MDICMSIIRFIHNILSYFSELLPEPSMKDNIVLFSLQSAATLVGIEAIQSLRLRFKLRHYWSDQDLEIIHKSEILNENPVESIQASDQSNDQEMQVISDESTSSQIDTVHLISSSLVDASDQFDGGKYFDGVFESEYVFDDEPPFDVIAFEASSRRKLHLLLQLCLLDYTLLIAIFDLYAGVVSQSNLSTPIPVTSETITTPSVEGVPPIAEESKKIESKISIFLKILETELSNIIPAIAKMHRPDAVFRSLMSLDPLALPLLESTLTLLLSDIHVPASNTLIHLVVKFSEVFFPVSQSSLQSKSIQFMLPVLGGVSSHDIETKYLPSLVKLFSDKPDVLRLAYQRIVSARPPAVAKSKFVVMLHRFEFHIFINNV
jgi:hypothetical protein